MIKNVDFKAFKHSNYKLDYNLLINTNFNKSIITLEVENELKKIVYNIFENHNNCTVNHIFIERETALFIKFEAAPNIQLSKLVNSFKTVSSRLIRKKFKSYFEEKHFWEQRYYIYTDNVIF